MFDDVSGAAEPVGEWALERLEAQLCLLAARSTATMYRWLVLVAEFDRRRACESWGITSTAGWVAWKCGLDVRTARDHVRVARALEQLPIVSERFASGELPYSKVRAVTRIATPATEAELADFASVTTTAQLDRAVRAYRRAVDGDDDEDAVRQRLFVDAYTAEDGTVRVTAVLPPAEGAVVLAALDHQAARIADERRPRRADRLGRDVGGGSREPWPVRVEALIAMAQSSLAGADPELVPDPYQVIVHAYDDGTSYLDDGSPITAELLARLACGASLQLLVEDRHGNPLYLGRRRRTITPSLRRALQARDGNRCRFPGCQARHYLQGHHADYWSKGGRTNIDDLALLCQRHHDLIHRGQFTMTLADTGGFEFRRPDGTIIPSSPPAPADDPAVATPEPTVAAPAGGTGERMHLDHAVTALLCTIRPDLVLGTLTLPAQADA